MSLYKHSKLRTIYNKNVKITNKSCFITNVTAPQAEYAHIIPLKTCVDLGYPEHAKSGHNSLTLSKNLHGTFELENNVPTFSFLRLEEKQIDTTKYKLVIFHKPNYLEEQNHDGRIFEMKSFKVNYLDLHYKICCYLYDVKPDDSISLLTYKPEFFTIFLKYKKYCNELISGKITIESESEERERKRKRVTNVDGCIDKADSQFRVTKILRQRDDLYLIKWNGKNKNGRSWADTWEPKCNIHTDLIKEFEARIKT